MLKTGRGIDPGGQRRQGSFREFGFSRAQVVQVGI